MNCAPLIRFTPDGKRRLSAGGGRLSTILAVAVTVSACAGEPTRFGASTRNVGADEAVVMPPPGNLSIVDVVEKRFDNALQQEIFLSTSSSVPGQNVMSVQFFGTGKPMKFSDDQLGWIPMTEARISSEMRGTLPGIRMVRSPLVVQNDYGAFGYAFGRPSGNELCMYGWQQIRSPAGTVSPLQNYGAIQIRVRLCETGASEEKLLSFMYGFSITGSLDDPGWNPYGTPPPVSSRLGRSGAPIYPPNTGESPLPKYGVSPLPSVAADAEKPRPAPRRRIVQEAADVPQAAAPAAPGMAEQYPGIVVPSPGAGLRRPAGASQAAPAAVTTRPVTARPLTAQQPAAQRPAVQTVPSPGTAGTIARPVRQVGPGSTVPSPGCVPGTDGNMPAGCR